MKNLSSSSVKNNLDKWVAYNGTGRYLDKDYIVNPLNDLSIIENVGMQQVQAEIYEFIDVLVKHNKLEICIDIGLGIYGSTHFLWRMIFNKTITIEYQKHRIFTFTENMNKFYNKFVLNDLKSKFIFGLSHQTTSVEKLDKILKGEKLDLLFIDGDHTYRSVLADWLIYKNFVAKGGIIAFHDCVGNDDGFGVPKLLKKIKSFDSKIKLKKIVNSKNFGIAYYYKS